MTPVALRRDGGLAVVTFDSPPLNLFDAALSGELADVLSELEAEPARAVLFRAEGRVVSGGVDVSLFAAQRGTDGAGSLFDGLIAIERRVEQLRCPTVFAAQRCV